MTPRTLRMLATALAVALAVGAALTAVQKPARASDGPSVVDVSWWTRVPAQSAPAGGLDVGVAPDGPTSVAALHLDLTSAGAAATRLVLTEGNGSVGGQAAGVRVCLTTATWQPTQGGALAAAPTASCGSTGVDLVRDAAGAWSAGLDPILAAEHGVVGLAVVPRPAQSPAFDLHFGPPAFTGASKAGAAGGTDSTVVAAGPLPIDSGSSGLPPGAVTGSDYQPVVVPGEGPTAASTVPPAVFGPPVAGDRAAVPLRITPSSHSRGRPYGKAFVYLLVSLVVGAAAATGRHYRPLLVRAQGARR